MSIESSYTIKTTTDYSIIQSNMQDKVRISKPIICYLVYLLATVSNLM